MNIKNPFHKSAPLFIKKYLLNFLCKVRIILNGGGASSFESRFPGLRLIKNKTKGPKTIFLPLKYPLTKKAKISKKNDTYVENIGDALYEASKNGHDGYGVMTTEDIKKLDKYIREKLVKSIGDPLG